MTLPTQTRTAIAEQILAAIFDEEGDIDSLVSQLTGSEEALAEAVALIARLAVLPGDHVRRAEVRLDALLDAVALAAESTVDVEST